VYRHTVGKPDEWTIVAFDFGWDEYATFSVSFTELLVDLIGGKMTGELLRSSEVNRRQLFFPLSLDA
jgi:hypothetical protein